MTPSDLWRKGVKKWKQIRLWQFHKKVLVSLLTNSFWIQMWTEKICGIWKRNFSADTTKKSKILHCQGNFTSLHSSAHGKDLEEHNFGMTTSFSVNLIDSTAHSLRYTANSTIWTAGYMTSAETCSSHTSSIPQQESILPSSLKLMITHGQLLRK